MVTSSTAQANSNQTGQAIKKPAGNTSGLDSFQKLSSFFFPRKHHVNAYRNGSSKKEERSYF
jgi:hypothetical protein